MRVTSFLFSSPKLGRDIAPLGLIVLVHIALLWTATHGMHQAVVKHATPKEVVATIITPDVPAQPAIQTQPRKVQAAPKPIPKPKPKPVPVAKKPLAHPTVAPVSPAEPATTPETMAALPQPASTAPTPETPAVTSNEAPRPATPAAPKTISGVEYLQAPQPEYPAVARRMGEQGKVILRVLISERGRPERVEVQRSSGFARLDEAARQAAIQALFKPHTEDGKPVSVYALIPISFSIQ